MAVVSRRADSAVTFHAVGVVFVLNFTSVCMWFSAVFVSTYQQNPAVFLLFLAGLWLVFVLLWVLVF